MLNLIRIPNVGNIIVEVMCNSFIMYHIKYVWAPLVTQHDLLWNVVRHSVENDPQKNIHLKKNVNCHFEILCILTH